MKVLNVRIRLPLALVATLPFATRGATISISTDFDHSGSGSLYTISVPSVSRSRSEATVRERGGNRGWSDSSSTCCLTPSPQFVQEVHEYEVDRLEEQRRIEEVRRAAEAE